MVGFLNIPPRAFHDTLNVGIGILKSPIPTFLVPTEILGNLGFGILQLGLKLLKALRTFDKAFVTVDLMLFHADEAVVFTLFHADEAVVLIPLSPLDTLLLIPLIELVIVDLILFQAVLTVDLILFQAFVVSVLIELHPVVKYCFTVSIPILIKLPQFCACFCAPLIIRVAGTNRDLLCSTAGLHVVVVAILYVALDACDVLTAAVGLIGLVLFHFKHPF